MAGLLAEWPSHRWLDVTVIVGLSGGADSVALLCALVKLREMAVPSSEGGVSGRLVAAHFNHALRGEESEGDARFCTELCRKLGVEIVVETYEGALSEKAREGLEEAARQARYQFLERVARQVGARYVVTAHTMNDQVETILYRILRGTGVAGLAGIPTAREFIPGVSLRRPLRKVSREEVDRFLQELGQDYRDDSSNESLDFSRNRIRHELLPTLRKDFNSQVDQALLRLGEQANDLLEVVQVQVDQAIAIVVKVESPFQIRVNGPGLISLHPWLQREVLRQSWKEQGWPLRDMGADEWELLRMIATRTAQQRADFPGGIRAEKKGEWLSLTHPSQTI